MALNPDLFTTLYKPDVLMCLADLSNDEVFTPPDIANQVLDMLPQELFRDPNTKFLDPALKSGVFLREIAKRLIAGLADKIPNLQDRCDHIFKNQLYGIAITELTSLLGRRSVYCSKYPNSPFSITKFDDVQGNIVFHKIRHKWDHAGVNGKCIFCGTAYDGDIGDINREGMETHAYEFIHTVHPEEIFDMKFDVIISNPPYQLNDGGGSNSISAKPIYQLFIKQAKKLNPKYITMIVPSRWFAGGKGLNDFRAEMLSDKRISDMVHYPKSRECFSGVDIAGGVNYFLWNRDYDGKCSFTSIIGEQKSTLSRDLSEFPVMLSDNIGVMIVRKINRIFNKKEYLNNRVLTRNSFGFTSKARGRDKYFNDAIKLYSSSGASYVTKKDVTKNIDLLDRYKVCVGTLNPDRGGVNNASDGKMSVTTKIRIINPNEVVTETYIVVGTFDTLKKARNFASYLQTKAVRYLISLTLSSMHIVRDNFQFVPCVNYDEPWDEKKINKLFELTDEEISYIDSLIRDIGIVEGENGGKFF